MNFDPNETRFADVLHAYARRGDISGIERVLALGVPVDFRDRSNTFRGTALHTAAGSPDAGFAVVEFLVDRGASLEAVSEVRSCSPLWAASRGNQLEKARWLLDRGAQVDASDAQGYTALIGGALVAGCSEAADRLATCRLLLERGADPRRGSSYGESPLSVTSRVADWEAVRLFLEAGAPRAELEWDDLMRAIALGSADDVAVELACLPDLSHRDRWERSAWFLAIAGGEIEKARLLLAAGFSVSAIGRLGAGVLHSALTRDNPDMIRWLASLGADLQAVDEFSRSVLCCAAADGRRESLKELLVRAPSGLFSEGELNRAMSETQSVEVARILVEAGGDIDLFDLFEFIRGHAGTSRELSEEVRIILECGWDLECSRSMLPLNAATEANSLEAMELLLTRGADPNRQDVDERAALSQCLTREAKELLLRHGASEWEFGARHIFVVA